MERKIDSTFRAIARAALILVALCGPASNAQDSQAGPAAVPSSTTYCTACHGPQGISQGPATPTIARLTWNYLVGAMLAYKYADNLELADDLIEQDEELWDVVVLARPRGVMNAVAEMLTLEEIKAIAGYFSEQDFVAPEQLADTTAIVSGEDHHDRYCGKCHEDGGANTGDDVGLLAGQWKLYLTYLMEDLSTGDRDMPKKMADKINGLREDHGDDGIRQLVEYYAGQVPTEGDHD